MKFKILLVALCLIGLTMPSFAGAAEKPEYVLKAGHIAAPNHVYHRILIYFADLVYERSDGRIKVKVYPSAKLGPAAQLLDGVRTGVIPICQVNIPHLSLFAPELGFFSVYYLFDSLDHWNRTFIKDPRMLEKLQKIVADKKLGLKLLTVSTYGSRNMWTKKQPVKSVADVKGLKIRIPPAKTETKLWQLYGATPTNIAWAEVYSALQTGVIDAGDGSINALMNKRFYEVAPYVSLTEHQQTCLTLVINEKFFNGLPKELQQVIEGAAKDASRFSVAASVVTTNDYLAKLKKAKGVTITNPDKESFRKVTLPYQKQSAKELGVEDLYGIILENRID